MNLDKLREIKGRFKVQYPFAAVGIGRTVGTKESSLEVRVSTQEEVDQLPKIFEDIAVNTEIVQIKPR